MIAASRNEALLAVTRLQKPMSATSAAAFHCALHCIAGKKVSMPPWHFVQKLCHCAQNSLSASIQSSTLTLRASQFQLRNVQAALQQELDSNVVLV